jgi:hypothetical protein
VVNELREDLDRALRTVTFGEAPIERAKQDGRRLRIRRRLTVAVGALAVAAVAAGYPALARSSAAPPAPATGQRTTPAPHASPFGGDMAVTASPPGKTTEAPGGLTDNTGQIAVGAIGAMKWQMSVVAPGPKNPVPADSCYTVTIILGTDIQGTCNDIPSLLGSGLGTAKPAAFTELSNDGTTETTVGEATNDVAYFIVNFDDGQQLKLIPVTVGGHRYIAWMAPLSMTIQYVVAHLGAPYSDSGQIAIAVPFEQPGQPPLFGLWQDGQSGPPSDTKVIWHGTTGGRDWKVTAYEGPWGTCFVADQDGSECVPAMLDTTTIFGWSAGSRVVGAFGWAAPGVASLRVTLSNGKTVTARPVGVGNEDLFAFPTGNGVSPTAWTAYSASGHQIGTGSMSSFSATSSASPSAPVEPSLTTREPPVRVPLRTVSLVPGRTRTGGSS